MKSRSISSRCCTKRKEWERSRHSTFAAFSGLAETRNPASLQPLSFLELDNVTCRSLIQELAKACEKKKTIEISRASTGETISYSRRPPESRRHRGSNEHARGGACNFVNHSARKAAPLVLHGSVLEQGCLSLHRLHSSSLGRNNSLLPNIHFSRRNWLISCAYSGWLEWRSIPESV